MLVTDFPAPARVTVSATIMPLEDVTEIRPPILWLSRFNHFAANISLSLIP
jgi:hypothetical protein